MKPYFVMLSTQRGGAAVPLTVDDEMGFFATIKEAKAAAESTVFGREFGYEVFELGYGIDGDNLLNQQEDAQ